MMFKQLFRNDILTRQKEIPRNRAMLVGVSGIDASGKGYIARQLAEQLELSGQKVALINVDGWLNLPHVRFSESNAGEHFYLHALRLDEMFEQLVLPLKKNRGLDLTMQLAEETATKFRSHTYAFENIDIILLEGIFIFKREFVEYFDLRIWIDCSFETALQRAIARGQEHLPPADTIAAYETIYFPAQRHHLSVDDPIAAAHIIYSNE
jgi:uridine kinase